MKLKLLSRSIILFFIFSFTSQRANAQIIGAGGYHSLIVCSSGMLQATGADWSGQLGDSTVTYNDINIPITVNGISGIIAIDGGEDFTIALKNDGTVWAWGYNGNGQLGDSTTTDKTYPIQVHDLTGVIAISAGAYHCLAVKSNGTVWAWGYNGYGQLGDGTTTQRTEPVQVNSISGITAVAAGYYHSLALKSNGTVYGWGRNSNGQLGNGTATNSSIPVLINSFTLVTAISAGYNHSLAVKSNGTAWGWGYNGYGQLGNGTTTSSNVPVQMTTITGAIRVSASMDAHSLILKSNGTVWGCGYNGNGDLGDGTTIQRSTPVQALNLTGVIAIATGEDHSIALKNDGTVWGWGYNGDGQLGEGSFTDHFTPFQIHFCCSNSPSVGLSGTCVTMPTTVQTGTSQQTFSIRNIGCTDLIVSNITSTNSAFVASPVVDTIAPFDSVLITVTFSPTVLGTNTGTLTIFNNDNDTTMCLTGQCVPAPSITFNPSSFNVTLNCGDTLMTNLAIGNVGAGTLNWNGTVTGYSGTSPTGYCAPAFTYNDCSSADWINNFSFNTLQNLNSGCNNNTNNYIYYPSITTTVQRGTAYTISMQSETSYSEGFGVWIDYNHDGDYADAGEFVYASPTYATTVFNGTVTIPSTALLGKTRIRVRCKYSGTVASGEYCSNFTYGECEEYDISIGAPGFSINPASGTVNSSGTQNVAVKFDSRGLNAGVYNYSLIVNSNDPNSPDTIPATMNVVGAAHMQFALFNTTQPCLNLDSIMANTISLDSLSIHNTGCDTLHITSLNISPAVYSVVSSPTTIAPGATKRIIVQFSPTVSGVYNGSLTVHTNVLDTTICLIGKAFPGPTISSSPTSFNVNLNCNDSTSLPLLIVNTGGGTLNYNVVVQNPAFVTSVPIAASCTPITIGTCCSMGIYNVTFGTINNTTGNATQGYQNYTATQSTFVNPGQTYTLSVQTGTGYNEYVSAWIDFNNDGVFQVAERVMNGNLNTLPNRFHTVTVTIPSNAVRNRAVRMRVGSEYSGYSAPQPCTNVQYGQFEDYTVKIASAVTVSSNTGTITAGGSSTINVNFYSTGLNAGTYTGNIIFTSNDPLNNPYLVPFTIHVSGVGTIVLTRSCLYLDSIMQNTTHKDSLYIKNTGCDTLHVTNITNVLSIFTVNQTVYNILPGDSAKLKVTFAPTAVGFFHDTLTILNNDVTQHVCLSGKAYPKPTMCWNPDSVYVSVGCADSVTIPLHICNSGGYPLYAQLSGGGQPIRGLIIGAENVAAYFTDVQTKLMGTGLFSSVTIFNGTTGTPTLAQLQQYDAVLVWGDANFTNSTLLGNNLADYVDAGGGVVTAIFSVGGANPILGRFNTGNYWCIGSSNGYTSGGPQTLGTVYNSMHPIMHGVTSFNGGTYSFRPNINTIVSGATRIADWSDGRPLAVTRIINGHKRADLGMWPVSGTAYSGGWLPTTDGALLMANALVWTSNGGVSWMTINPTSDTVVAGDTSIVNLKFNSTGLAVGNYSATITINSNDPLNSAVTIPALMNVFGVGHIVLTRSCLYLDSIMQYTTHTDSLYVKNTGCDTLHVTNITHLTSIFTTNQTSFIVLPGDSVKLIVTFAPTAVGTFIDTLTILNDNVTKKVCLSGKAFPKPQISTNPTSVSVTLACCDTLNFPITVSNVGANNLYYTINNSQNFFEGFENGLSRWVTGGATGYNWTTVADPHTGTYSLKEHAIGSYGNNWNQYIELAQPLTVTNAAACVMTFWEKRALECGYDNFYVQLSVNGGAYTTLTTYTCSDNPYNLKTFNLTPYVTNGSTFKIRFLFTSDGSVTYAGVNIDDITITGTQGIPDYLSVTPSADTISSGNSSTLNLQFISCGKTVGVYNSNLIINSNDPLHLHDTIPVTMNVVGAPIIALTRNCLNLDSIMQYTTHIDSLYIKNTGCDTLLVSNITTQTSIYTVNNTAYTIIPGDSAKLIVTFAPIAVGTFIDTVTILNNDVTKRICLTGKGYAKPTISINPTVINVTVSCSDSLITPLTIYNTGGSNLNWNATGGGGNGTAPSGYCYPTMYGSNPCNYLNSVTTTGGTANITTAVDGGYNSVSGAGVSYYPAAMVSQMPGGSYTLTVQAQGSCNIAYYTVWVDWNRNGVFDAGELMVHTGNVGNAITNLTINVPANASIGFTRMRVICWGTSTVPAPCGNLSGTYGETEDYNVRVGSPGLSILPASGSVTPLDSQIVNLTFNSQGLVPGVYSYPIIITSNDPLSPVDTVQATMTVVGTSQIVLSTSSCLDLDSIMTYTTSKDSLMIMNVGCDTLFISNITNQLSVYSVNTTTYMILPGDTATLVVTFSPLVAGTYNDTLTIINNNATQHVCLHGIAYPKPVQCHNPPSLDVHFTICQDSIAKQISVCNTNGGSNLNWNLTSNPGRSAVFDGNGDYISRNSVNLPTGSIMTAEAWIYPTSYQDANYNGIVSWGTRGCYGSFLLSIQSNGRPSMANWCNDFVPNTGPAAVLNQWNHIACVMNGASVTLYMNGVAVSGTIYGGENVQSMNLAIGSTDYPGRTFNGKIDEVRVYNRVLSQAEILASMNNVLVGNENGLMGYWNFENGTANDLTANGNNGILNDNTYITPASWVNFNPQSSTTVAGGSTTVNAMFYKAGLGFGVHNYSIFLNSNDPLNLFDSIPVTVTVDSIPPTPPVSANVSDCFGNPIPAFTATGNSGDTIKWYDSTMVLQHVGATYNTGLTAVGLYTFYVTSTDSINGCESRADTVTLHINSAPTQPTASDASACFGTSIPALSSTGTIQLWYTNPGLTNHVFTGNPYNTGLTAAGTYTFYVSDSTTGCPKSPADTVTLTIHALPSKPVATDASSCFGAATPSLSATGTGSDTIKWYNSSLVFIQNGNPLVTGLSSPGVYNFYVTQTDSLLGCISPRDTATLTIHFTPQPTANNQTGCFGSASTTLTATGTNLKWYNSAMTLMFSGNPYNTGLTAVGVDTFYVTQTLNGCESTPKMVILTINPIPSTPVAPDITICFGTATPALTATGTTIQWYSNPTLTTLVHSGSPYNTGLTAVGNYTFYVTQSSLGCASHPDTVHLIIGPIPVRPITSDVNACFGFSVSDFVAASTGSDTVKWFSNPGLTTLVYTGNPFATGQTAIGTYTYYVNQTDTSSGCHSFSDTVTLVINSTPVQPTANDVNACFGQTIPPMTSTGTIIQWYNDTALTNLVHTGATYYTGLTAVGSYTFYIKDSTAGCASSTADTATLNIYPIPTAPATSGNASICIGQSNPALTATGTNINWYSNSTLTTLVHTGSSFTPSQTTAGTYTFYVTQTANGCSSLASIVVFTIYYTPPVSVSNISIPFGTATPDLIAVGSNINWYNTAMVNVSTNDTFATGQTAIGAYTYYVTQTLNGCESTPDTVTLTIHPLAPVSTNQVICFGNTVPDLTATGTNINWYSNSTLTTLVHSGSTFPTGQTAVGVYTYYVTQTVNSIPSPATIVTLTINAIPTAPVSANQTACVGGTIPNLASSGINVQWYDSTFVVHNGTPFATGHTSVGVYNYTVTQTVSGCESPHTSVSLTINSLPSIPVASDTSSCFGSTTPALTAAGTNINWFNSIGTPVGTGSPYATGITAAGVYNFLVTQTNSSTGCQSLSDTVTLTINFTPPPVNSNVNICAGLPVPPLTATGTNIQWFNSSMTQVATGSSYNTGQTAVGVYTYFVTQTNTVTGCQSIPDSVVLIINAVPVPPISNDVNACFGQTVPPLAATGSGIQWYTTSMTFLSSGNSYNTGQTAVGTYYYNLTQTAGGCESPPYTVILNIYPTPAAPVTPSNTSICFGQANPTLTATGTTINWYSDSTLVTLVHSGSTFTPTQTSPGVYTYYVTQTVNGCNSPASVVTFTIYFTPPVSVSDISIPFGTPTPDLIAVGNNITWYDTAMVTVSTNDTFATGQTAIGVYTYYVSQTLNGCQSTLDTVLVTIYPSNPPAANQTACFGTTIPDLYATGVNIQWYSDSLLTNLVYAGNPFSTLQTAVGVYTYYVTQTISGIESPATTVTLTINAIPTAPVAANQNACFEGTIPNLSATGTSIQWYDTTFVVFNGNPFATGQTNSGVYSYSVTQTANGCESPHTAVTLTINALPTTPISADTAICFGTPTPDLTSTGVNIQWYDTSLTVVGAGSPFATGITAGGVHTFFVTQTNSVTGCESHADTVNLTIHFTPPPVAPDVYVCALYSIPSLTATGTNIQWYDSSMTFVHSGNSYNTGQTAIGTHVYFVTQTDSITGCTSTPDSVILSINTAPAAPIVTNATACFGQSITPLTAVGSNLQWYGDTTLTTVLFAGNPYNTGQTAVGTYTYYVTQTTFGCEGPADSISLTIYPTPAMPTTSGNAAICFGQTNPAFTATGTNLNWYSDSTLTTLVASGGTFTPAQSAPGVYIYYITQSANGCSSPYTTVVFTINLTPPVSVSDVSTVFGSATPDLIAVGSNITWYDTAMVSVSTNDTFATGQTAVGVYTYYVSQTLNGCESTLDTAVLTIFPPQPIALDQTGCYGNIIPDLTASGINVQWYDVNFLPVYSGNLFATGDTAVGSYVYYVNQTVNNVISGQTMVTLTINPIPSAPVASNQSVCAGGAIPDLTTSGTNITWYDTAMVTVSTNDTFATGQTNAGVYTYTVTQTVNGCQSPADTATLTIYAIPVAPTTSANTAICFGTANPAFTATGTNVQWYSDSLLTTLVFTGSPYTPVQTTAGTYTYYVTDSMNGCTSPVSTVALTINFTPPVSANDTMVAYSLPTPDLITSGTNITWYDTAMVVVSTNDTFATGQTAVGVYTYYVTQTMNGCESTPDTVVLTIYPGAPIVASQVVCAGNSIPDLTAVGLNIQWYNNAQLDTLVYSGSPFATGQTAPGTYVYYATQTVNGIQSPAAADTLTINSVPDAPLASNQAACFGGTVPDLITSGTNIHWYDTAMVNVSTLDTFATGQTAAGVYVYTVTETANGCESAPDTVSLTIHALPATPVATDASACFGSPVPDLTSTGNNLMWYDTASVLAGTGSPFATGMTASGVYTYHVTDMDTVTGCSSYPDTATLVISVQPNNAPTVANVITCTSLATPDLVSSTGTIIHWYSDATLTTLVNTGTTFTTGQTVAGTYTYYVTDSLPGCLASPVDTATLTINTQPTTPPAVADIVVCSGGVIPDLVATTGTIVNWYSDTLLTNLVNTGANFPTGQTTAGVYTYYVNDNIAGCPAGMTDTVSLTIHQTPAMPTVDDTAICFRTALAILIYHGEDVQWYNTSMVVVHSGDVFNTGHVAPGVFPYYVTQTDTITGCVSPVDSVNMIINALPGMPITSDVTVCASAVIPDLTAIGNNIQWTDTAHVVLYNGTSFATGQTIPGAYSYYVIQNDTVSGCGSDVDTATLVILPVPTVPVANNVTVCTGNPVPDLTSTGTNVTWYNSAALTTILNTGNTYTTGQTAAGNYTYFVTDSVGGCTSTGADSVMLTINQSPPQPTAHDTTICIGGSPVLFSTGNNPHWYSDVTLINYLGNGNNFNTGDVNAGTYTYYVTDNNALCPNSAPDTAHLTINPAPLITANTYSASLLFGNSVTLTAYNAVSYSWAPPTGLNTTTGATVIASPTVTTTYTVTGTNAQGCSSDTVIHVVVTHVGIDEIGIPLEDVLIYPNPAIDEFTIEFSTTDATSIDIYLFNTLGQNVRTVSEEKINGGMKKHKYTFDSSTLDAGVYTIEIATEQGSVSRRLVLIK